MILKCLIKLNKFVKLNVLIINTKVKIDNDLKAKY